MSHTTIYKTAVSWKGEHLGHLVMGNGPEMYFSAPPDAMGLPGVLTPEDAFVAAVNTCIMMMFLWSCERLKLYLISYQCRAEGTKLIELDKTEIFTKIELFPEISVNANNDLPGSIEDRILRALKLAQKFSLVANSIKSEVKIDPVIKIIDSTVCAN
ncbi:MAG: OsmC family protein [Anaerolineales bacterium]